jgi:hypothetical protein
MGPGDLTLLPTSIDSIYIARNLASRRHGERKLQIKVRITAQPLYFSARVGFVFMSSNSAAAAFRLEVKGQLQRRRKKLAADCHERAAQNRAQEQRVYGCDGMPAELVAARSALRSMQAPSNILVTAKYD